VRKLTGMNKPSRANAPAFERAVDDVARVAHELLHALETQAPPRNRELEARRARERSLARFGKRAPAEA
jgi:hypothetical protein